MNLEVHDCAKKQRTVMRIGANEMAPICLHNRYTPMVTSMTLAHISMLCVKLMAILSMSVDIKVTAANSL